MGTPTESITLHGEAADRFREIKQIVREEGAFGVTNTETVHELMREFDEREYRR
jgi:hypothetical protein